jgi:hypothetical protein
MAKIIKRVEVVITVDSEAQMYQVTRKQENLTVRELIGLHELERVYWVEETLNHEAPKESEVKPDEPTEQS